jgi:hypothetical protein
LQRWCKPVGAIFIGADAVKSPALLSGGGLDLPATQDLPETIPGSNSDCHWGGNKAVRATIPWIYPDLRRFRTQSLTIPDFRKPGV